MPKQYSRIRTLEVSNLLGPTKLNLTKNVKGMKFWFENAFKAKLLNLYRALHRLIVILFQFTYHHHSNYNSNQNKIHIPRPFCHLWNHLTLIWTFQSRFRRSRTSKCPQNGSNILFSTQIVSNLRSRRYNNIITVLVTLDKGPDQT